MGFFGGKKNKDKDKEAVLETQAPKKSRRIVAPGGKPAAPAAPNAPAPAPASNKTAIVKLTGCQQAK